MPLQIPSPRARTNAAPRGPASAVGAALTALVVAFGTLAACSTSDVRDGRRAAGGAQLPSEPGASGQEVSPETGRDDDGGLVLAIDVSTGCKVDTDCLRVEKGCCNLGEHVAVLKSKAASYQQGLHCERVTCPQVVVPEDHSVAQCNVETATCEIVLPTDVACNGFTTNPHACPKGWRCRRADGHPGPIADIPGRCAQMCGGIAGLQCTTSGAKCIDDPDDDCDPKKGGADCSGICVTAAN